MIIINFMHLVFSFTKVLFYSSLHWIFFSQIVCFRTMEYVRSSICDVIASQKGSNGDGKLHFFGRDYMLLALFAQI